MLMHGFALAVLAFMAQSFLLPASAEPTGLERDVRSYNLARGRVIFTDKCVYCHESGRKGAPVLGDVEDWSQRLNQSLDTMIAHAINGHGKMPARGDQDLSDQDVATAVAYVVYRASDLVATEIDALPPTAAGVGDDKAKERSTSDQAVVHMFLLLLNHLESE